MRKKLVSLAICLLCGSMAHTATILYHQNGNASQRKKMTDVALLKIDWRYVTFIQSGKTYKIRRKWMDAFIPDAVSDNKTTSPAPEKAQVVKITTIKNKSFPTSLAAYILHCRYLFGAGQSDDWYYGKRVTVSGVVDINNIKRVKKYNLSGIKATGQYQVPMLNGAITCLSNDSLEKLTAVKSIKSSKYAVEVSKRYVVMKFIGTVIKSSRYKEAFINNARLISSRYIISYRNCKRTTLGGKYITRSQWLAKTSNLQHSAYLEQKARSMGRIQCDMGTDPEAYAMEVHWLRKLYKPAKKLTLVVSGIPYADSNKFGKLSDGSIVRWSVSYKK